MWVYGVTWGVCCKGLQIHPPFLMNYAVVSKIQYSGGRGCAWTRQRLYQDGDHGFRFPAGQPPPPPAAAGNIHHGAPKLRIWFLWGGPRFGPPQHLQFICWCGTWRLGGVVGTGVADTNNSSTGAYDSPHNWSTSDRIYPTGRGCYRTRTPPPGNPSRWWWNGFSHYSSGRLYVSY